MATRKPLVVVNGQVQQLQAGDTIANAIDISQVNDEAGAIVIGTPVYNDVADGVKKAKADAAATVRVLGLVTDVTVSAGQPANVRTSDVLVATTGQWDAITGQTGGLTPGAFYYLDPATAGKMTTATTSTTGQYLVRLGQAISATEFDIRIDPTSILM
jgi:hypothetical protein